MFLASLLIRLHYPFSCPISVTKSHRAEKGKKNHEKTIRISFFLTFRMALRDVYMLFSRTFLILSALQLKKKDRHSFFPLRKDDPEQLSASVPPSSPPPVCCQPSRKNRTSASALSRMDAWQTSPRLSCGISGHPKAEYPASHEGNP